MKNLKLFADVQKYDDVSVPKDGRELLFIYETTEKHLKFKFIVVRWIDPQGWIVIYYADSAAVGVDALPDYYVDLTKSLVDIQDKKIYFKKE